MANNIDNNTGKAYDQQQCRVNVIGTPKYSMYELPGFLSALECEEIKELAKKVGMHRSEVYGTSQDVVDSSNRKSYTAWLTDSLSPTVRKITDMTVQLTGLVAENQEDLQVLRYPEGGFFSPHYDCCEGGPEECSRMNANGGPRRITLIIYLNDDFKGGETVFPKMNVAVQPQRGKAVVFWSTDDRDRVIEEAYHGGNPVQQGEKWICNKWIHARAYK